MWFYLFLAVLSAASAVTSRNEQGLAAGFAITAGLCIVAGSISELKDRKLPDEDKGKAVPDSHGNS